MEKKYSKISRKVKSVLKKAAILYVVTGSLYSLGETDTTWHRSADIYLGKSKPTYLEKTICNFVADKLGIEAHLE